MGKQLAQVSSKTTAQIAYLKFMVRLLFQLKRAYDFNWLLLFGRNFAIEKILVKHFDQV